MYGMANINKCRYEVRTVFKGIIKLTSSHLTAISTRFEVLAVETMKIAAFVM
jgi:hypothetical protein